MDKYRTVPIISADDDCLYKFNYAEELYQHWLKHKDSFVTYWCSKICNTYNTAGYATLHPPYIYRDAIKYLSKLRVDSVKEDDLLYVALRMKLKLNKCICLNKSLQQVVNIYGEIAPLHNTYKGRSPSKTQKLIMNIKNFLYEFDKQ